jgi:DNA-binding Lrp family transcriptional regulator
MPERVDGGMRLSDAEQRVARLSIVFVADQADISRAGGDVLEPLVFAAIVQANQALLRNAPAVVARYGESPEAIPDHLRRPISINAVAESLRLPFESVRRKVRVLIDKQQCVSTPSGVYVPRSAIVSPRHAAIQAERLARLMRFHDALLGVGFLAPEETLAAHLPEAMKRPANRALSQYMLRTVDHVVELTGDLTDGFLLLGLAAFNLRRDGDPAPRSALALAGSLGMSSETVRRRLAALEEAGLARRTPRGWIAGAPEALHERLFSLAAENAADLRRLFARLKVLAEAQEDAGAARDASGALGG